VNALVAMGARLVTMAISLVCGVISARLVLGEAGVATYALMALLIAIPTLISFTDLGAGAVVVNSVATSDDLQNDELLLRQVLSVSRVIAGFAGAVLVLNTVLSVTGGWKLVLGSTATVPNATAAASVCMLIFCLTISLGVWQRILLGLGKNPLIILLQGIISPFSLLLVVLTLRFGPAWATSFLALATFTATLLTAALGMALADRLTRPLMRTVAKRVLFPRRFPGARVMHVGWPMFAQLLVGPLAFALPRFILANSADQTTVAQHALGAQVFFALQALIMAGATSLWPMFAKARAKGTIARGPYRLSAAFVGIVIAATAFVLVIRPWFFSVMSNGVVDVPARLVIAFGLMVAVQAVLYPLGMFIMDEKGIRFQVLPALSSAAATVALTVALAPHLGAAAPPVANAVAAVTLQVIPFIIYIRLHRSRLYGTGPTS
jgi:O-antigen/teichoic acid export membrane protein